MTDLSKNQNYRNTPVIYLVSGHTKASPGGVFGGRTEADDCSRLCFALENELKGLDSGLHIKVLEGSCLQQEMNEDDLLFVFHEGTSCKSSPKKGAAIFVKENADVKIQYEAFSLLSTVCSKYGFRYNGVHPEGSRSPFKSLQRALPERTFFIVSGYIESSTDNLNFDSMLSYSLPLAGEILKIYKERKNEDNTTVYKASFGGEQIKAS